MKMTIVAAAAALLLAQGAAASAEPGSKGRATDPNKKICRSQPDIGTRLGGKLICRTSAEWAQVRAESRRVVERIQDNKPTICTPGRPC